MRLKLTISSYGRIGATRALLPSAKDTANLIDLVGREMMRQREGEINEPTPGVTKR
ncbi:MAG: hypothetical protein J2P52_15130 [Blastocatellia bacterium]|nr:hypothetical protein [Blastocatellia bacterium]